MKDRDMWVIGKKSKRPREDIVGDERTNIRQMIEGEKPYNPVSSEDKDNSSDSIEFRTRSDMVFKGVYKAPDDPLVTAKQQVEMAAQEVWRCLPDNRIKDHKKQKLEHCTQFWCSQDSACKKKSKISEDLNIKSHDNIRMTRYPCHNIIWEHVEWLTSVAMVAKVQAAYAGVTAAQVHKAWMDMSQLFWHCDDLQLPSVKKLLEEFTDTVDIFSPNSIPDGVDILCWGMRKIAVPLEGKIVEVGIDATSTSIEQGKRKKALTAWAVCLKDKYAINLVFTHIDKDMVEIGMAKEQAHAEFPIIDIQFIPPSKADTQEYEGGLPDDVQGNPVMEGGKNVLEAHP
ncbi:hypothetical protein BU17DRAFT_61987 [Hysterangium stoloniferum]|nr:hypothetical protein BU17DRAFT_61987 [Hysterangium stoloniferum]